MANIWENKDQLPELICRLTLLLSVWAKLQIHTNIRNCLIAVFQV